jgi:hypothetical protein
MGAGTARASGAPFSAGAYAGHRGARKGSTPMDVVVIIVAIAAAIALVMAIMRRRRL